MNVEVGKRKKKFMRKAREETNFYTPFRTTTMDLCSIHTTSIYYPTMSYTEYYVGNKPHTTQESMIFGLVYISRKFGRIGLPRGCPN